MCKNLVKHLPTDRPYSEVEAAYSLQLDYDNSRKISILGYSKLWDWSRARVRRFLDRMGVSIDYPENTKKVKKQTGHITGHKRDIKPKKGGHIRFVNSKDREPSKDIKQKTGGHKKDIRGYTTRKPINPKPINNAPFSEIVAHLNKKTGKRFRPSTEQTRRLINARWNEGYRLDDFIRVIDQKAVKWINDPKMADYLRPETLFGCRFESYLNEQHRPLSPDSCSPKAIDFENQFHHEGS